MAEQPNTGGVAPHQDAKTIVLDLMNPGGRLAGGGRHGSMKSAEGRLR
jgi:hypothetical protein